MDTLDYQDLDNRAYGWKIKRYDIAIKRPRGALPYLFNYQDPLPADRE